MKRVRIGLVPAAAACLAAILAAAAVANAGDHGASARPFKGSMSGTATFVTDAGCPLGLRTNSEAVGTASHLGSFTYTSSHCSNFVFAGEQTLVAANGDEVFADYESVGPPVFPPSEVGTVYDVPVAFTITGGTGRFAGATGGGEIISHITFMGFGAPVWPATWEWQGTIGY